MLSDNVFKGDGTESNFLHYTYKSRGGAYMQDLK